MFKTYKELANHLAFRGFAETRNQEFKGGLSWSKLKIQIVKASLSLANLQDGGSIIIGIEEDENAQFHLRGMKKEISETFKLDDIQSFVNEYADPPIEITLNKIENNGNYFIEINILEFEEQPVICKKDLQRNNKIHLNRGHLYYRPKHKIESTDNFSHHDMRELMMFATEKFHSAQLKSCEKLKEVKPSDDEKIKKEFFDKELDGF